VGKREAGGQNRGRSKGFAVSVFFSILQTKDCKREKERGGEGEGKKQSGSIRGSMPSYN